MLTIGVDEVGRGCWAGPLVAAAVLLDPKCPVIGLDDSKRLKKSDRERLDILIRENALAYGIGWVGSSEIDSIGLTASVCRAMEHAYCQLVDTITQSGRPGLENLNIIIDGNYNYLPTYKNVSVLVGADGLLNEVSAASIIAKVARDKYMSGEAAATYPQYGFDKHVGYGTAHHMAMLREYGVSPIHRRSYEPIKRLL